MEILNFFAMAGMTINDLVSMYSVVGSLMLFVGSFFAPPRFRNFGNWSILGLGFGFVSQIAMAITSTTPEKVGILLPMSPILVDAILLVSLLLIVAQWQIQRNKQRFSQNIKR